MVDCNICVSSMSLLVSLCQHVINSVMERYKVPDEVTFVAKGPTKGDVSE